MYYKVITKDNSGYYQTNYVKTDQLEKAIDAIRDEYPNDIVMAVEEDEGLRDFIIVHEKTKQR